MVCAYCAENTVGTSIARPLFKGITLINKINPVIYYKFRNATHGKRTLSAPRVLPARASGGGIVNINLVNNNPSVSFADISLCTREPQFSSNSELIQAVPPRGKVDCRKAKRNAPKGVDCTEWQGLYDAQKSRAGSLFLSCYHLLKLPGKLAEL